MMYGVQIIRICWEISGKFLDKPNSENYHKAETKAGRKGGREGKSGEERRKEEKQKAKEAGRRNSVRSVMINR